MSTRQTLGHSCATPTRSQSKTKQGEMEDPTNGCATETQCDLHHGLFAGGGGPGIGLPVLGRVCPALAVGLASKRTMVGSGSPVDTKASAAESLSSVSGNWKRSARILFVLCAAKLLMNGFFARLLILEAGKRAVGREPSLQGLPESVTSVPKWWTQFGQGDDQHQNLAEGTPSRWRLITRPRPASSSPCSAPVPTVSIRRPKPATTKRQVEDGLTAIKEAKARAAAGSSRGKGMPF